MHRRGLAPIKGSLPVMSLPRLGMCPGQSHSEQQRQCLNRSFQQFEGELHPLVCDRLQKFLLFDVSEEINRYFGTLIYTMQITLVGFFFFVSQRFLFY